MARTGSIPGQGAGDTSSGSTGTSGTTKGSGTVTDSSGAAPSGTAPAPDTSGYAAQQSGLKRAGWIGAAAGGAVGVLLGMVIEWGIGKLRRRA